MLILGIDFESTGLDAKLDDVIEIGAVLWNTQEKCPLVLYSTLVHTDKEVTQEITKITGITKEMITKYGEPPLPAFSGLLKLARQAELIVAHNAKFDKEFFDALCARFQVVCDTPWACTISDVDYPDTIKHKNLISLAGEHDFVNPFKHRALFDVLTMLRILSHYNIEEVLENAKMPKITLRAVVSFADKDKAKQAGYSWNGEKKIWLKEFRQDRAAQEMLRTDFKVVNLSVG